MSEPNRYVPSRLLPGGGEALRERAFTRWMSIDLRQAATDFCKNIGLMAIYSESSAEGLTRYLFWNPPKGAGIEVRSGRTYERFATFDQANRERGWALLSLHISENELYSAVWISPREREAGEAVLAAYGITPAERANP